MKQKHGLMRLNRITTWKLHWNNGLVSFLSHCTDSVQSIMFPAVLAWAKMSNWKYVYEQSPPLPACPSSYLPTYTNPTLIVLRVASGEALKPSSIQSRWRVAEGWGLFSPRPRGRWLWARAERQTKSRPQGRALVLLARKRLTNCCGEKKRICKDRLEVVLNWPPRFLRITGRGAHLLPALHFTSVACLTDNSLCVSCIQCLCLKCISLVSLEFPFFTCICMHFNTGTVEKGTRIHCTHKNLCLSGFFFKKN